MNGLKAELIAVGTELLTGQIVNTNAQYLSEKCAELGIDVYFQTAVGDNPERLLSVLEVARSRSNLVILCGGLGPTDDDLTKQTLAVFLNRELETDPQAMEKLDRFFASRPERVRTPNNDKQAQLIQGSHALQNPAGLAVGAMLEVDGVTYVVLPGPPTELKAMFTHSLQPLLAVEHQQLYSRVLRFFGIGESQLVTVLSDLIEGQTDPTVAPYAKTGEVTLRLSTKADNQEQADLKFDRLEAEIVGREDLAAFLYGYGEDNSLAQVVAKGLEEEGLSIAFLEQSTAGAAQAKLAAVLQDHTLYRGGRILPQLKMDRVVLSKELEGVRNEFQSDLVLGIALTAQPNSQMDTVIARVFLALEWKGKMLVREVTVSGYSWQHVQELAVLHAFNLVRKTLLNSKTLL